MFSSLRSFPFLGDWFYTSDKHAYTSAGLALDEQLLLRFDEIDRVHSLWLLRKCTEEVNRDERSFFLPTDEGSLAVKDRHQATNMTLPTLNETQFTHANPHQTLSTHTVLHPQNMSLAQISMMNNTLSRRSSILTTTVVGGPSTGAPGGGSSSPIPNNLLTNPRRLASMAVISYE